MQAVPATISDHLQVRIDDLPDGALEQIKSYLTIASVDKARALERGDYGAQDLPDAFQLWDDDLLGTLIMPRGFARTFASALGEVEWRDMTSTVPMSLVSRVSMHSPDLRPEQEIAVQAIIRERQGIIQAAPGTGKTTLALEAARRIGQRTLVLVEKGHLVRQWRERAEQHIGLEAGVIGDGEWDERDLTIATMQTLYRRLPDLRRDEWFKTWGTTFSDEFHHGVAETYREVLEHICSHYFIGLTATPLEGDWLQKLLVALAGPIIHKMSDTVTVSPTIKIVPTSFEWRPTKYQSELTDPRAIYRHLIKALEEDHDRVELIVETIAAQPESCSQLVLSKRLGYLDLIKAGLMIHAGWSDERIMMYRGQEKLDEREAIAARAMEGSCVILSTVADEGLDIPRLDRLHLTWPTRKDLTITQQVGRIARNHEGKLPPVAFDYVDVGNTIFYDQHRSRRRLYKRMGWEMVVNESRAAA